VVNIIIRIINVTNVTCMLAETITFLRDVTRDFVIDTCILNNIISHIIDIVRITFFNFIQVFKSVLCEVNNNMDYIRSQSIQEDFSSPIASMIINSQRALSGQVLESMHSAGQRTAQLSGKNYAAEVFKSPKRDLQLDIADESLRKMRRVDWRWAAAKGFLDKDTNQWNEALGGLEGYIRQRTERVLARCVHAGGNH
jgi:hypothetical protein